MGNPDLLFIFTLPKSKWKTIIKGQNYNSVCQALLQATQELETEYLQHNLLADQEMFKPENERMRFWVDYSPANVQIEEIFIPYQD